MSQSNFPVVHRGSMRTVLKSLVAAAALISLTASAVLANAPTASDPDESFAVWGKLLLPFSSEDAGEGFAIRGEAATATRGRTPILRGGRLGLLPIVDPVFGLPISIQNLTWGNFQSEETAPPEADAAESSEED